eukprot:XP_017945210.1 PREDICTED: vomeronasal type-2 receptor 26-like [Xenopus tropicalis]
MGGPQKGVRDDWGQQGSGIHERVSPLQLPRRVPLHMAITLICLAEGLECRTLIIEAVCLLLVLSWYQGGVGEALLEGCRLLTEDVIGYSLAGDITLGGLFSVHMNVSYPVVNFRERPQPIQCSRTIHNANYEVFALAQLLKYFNWTWVGIISSDNDLGRSGAQLVSREIENNGGCIAFNEILPIVNFMESVFRIIDVIQKSRAKVIIVFCTVESFIPFIEEASLHNITDKLLHYIKHIRFNNLSGDEIYFDENGDVPLYLDILNWQMFPNGSNQYVSIGSFNARAPKGQQLKIQEDKILWNVDKIPVSVCSDPCPKGHRRATIQGQKICCFDCLPCSEGEILNPNGLQHLHSVSFETNNSECLKCPEDQWPDRMKERCLPKTIQFLSYDEPLGSSLACISVLFCLITFSAFCLFIAKRKTPIVKANNRELSYLLLISLMFGFLCSLAFIGRPNLKTCMIRQVLFAVIFSFCISVILAKTVTVIMIFSATNPDSKLKRLVAMRIPVYIVPVCTMGQIILCIVWLARAAPFPEFNMAAEIGKIVTECNEGSRVLFACVLGYMGLLAAISLLVACLARKLPDTFNETKFITFSMLVFASVWLTFIPAYLSTKGKQTVAVEIFAILSSMAGLLVCIFFPKCYIILLHPEMNTKQYITGRNTRNRGT